MKLFKRFIVLLLALTVVMTALSACKEQVTPDVRTVDESIEESTEERTEKKEFVDYAASVKLDMDSETMKQKVSVHLYVDGDTTHFEVPSSIDPSGILKARYLGVNTPESTGVIEKWGKQASNFTKEKLSNAETIYVESDDENWNFDNTTSHRCLLWIWYQPKGELYYRNLNIELLQEGLAIASNSGQNRYGETCMAAISQAKEYKLHYYSNEVDPLFYEGEVREVTLKALRTTPEEFLNQNVSFEATIVREYNNSLYVQEFDDEDDLNYGITVYLGFSADPDVLSFTKLGNRVKFIGSLQYYEAGGTYQVSGIKYNARKPQESCALVEENVGADFPVIDPKTFASGKKTVTITSKDENDEPVEEEKEYDYASLIMSTSVTMEGLKVSKAYTTKSGKSEGAMTLTCTAPDGTTVDVRTTVLVDEEGNMVTDDAYLGKTINVRGVVDYYSGSYQIKVFTLKDIVIAG
ncbi:MAG: thermonuclease family protein [Lachnospiraceae bacterium]|nr:thermonuclease family protein [Lachnospiraceae bacterium]